jgi:hypothetical protein
MAKYLFRLEKLHINAQRNNVADMPDFDVVTFGIEIGARQYGPLKNYGWWRSKSGMDLDFTTIGLRHGADDVARGKWEIGPIDVADDDVMSIDYAVVNAYDAISRAQSSHGNTSATTTQVTVASFAALLGVAGAATAGFGAVVLAVGAGLLAVVGLLIKDPRICDGVVGANKKFFTGAELRRATTNPQHMFWVSETTGNPNAGDCSPSEIIMTYSVTLVPYYSMKAFCKSKSNLTVANWTGGFRDYTKAVLPQLYNGPSTSVRYVIENWELLVIS